MHALSLLVALSLSAGPDGNATFEKLKTLEGSWKTGSKEAPQFVSFRLVGGGTAVMETTTDTTNRSNMAAVTVYAIEGGELVATRHDASGATRFKFKDADATAIRFVDGAKSLSLTIKESKLKVETGKQSLDLLREYVDTLK